MTTSRQTISQFGIIPFWNYRCTQAGSTEMRVAKSIYDEEYRTIIDALKAARKSAGLTQQSIAEALRRPQSYVAKIEGYERRLDIVEFLHFCRAVGVKPASVFAGMPQRT